MTHLGKDDCVYWIPPRGRTFSRGHPSYLRQWNKFAATKLGAHTASHKTKKEKSECNPSSYLKMPVSSIQGS